MNTGSHLKTYRIFDIAHEVLMDEAYDKLAALGPTHKYTLKRLTKDFLFSDIPLVVNLGNDFVDDVEVTTVVKLWSYGAISLCMTIAYEGSGNREELTEWLRRWCECEAVDAYCLEKIETLKSILEKSLKGASTWGQREEYSIFVTNSTFKPLDFWIEDQFVYNFLTMETKVSLSSEMIQPIKECSLSYGQNDLVIIDWDNGFVFSSEDVDDICDVVELANVQLLELRFFDDLLDAKLSKLYRQVVEKRPSVFNSTIALLSRDASQLYIETSEVVERIENSLKIVGDIYFARLYRLALKRLQLIQWQGTVDSKLKNLLDISQMYTGELNTKRGFIMEVVIIILIAVEVFHFFSPYLEKGLALILKLARVAL